MIAREPVLGYPSKTAAAWAMQDDGKSPRQIGVALGITTKAAYALLYERRRQKHERKATAKPDAAQPTPRARLSDLVGFTTLAEARKYAAKRDMSVDLFLQTLIDTVILGDLVDAVFDDADEVN